VLGCFPVPRRCEQNRAITSGMSLFEGLFFLYASSAAALAASLSGVPHMSVAMPMHLMISSVPTCADRPTQPTEAPPPRKSTVDRRQTTYDLKPHAHARPCWGKRRPMTTRKKASAAATWPRNKKGFLAGCRATE